MFPPVEYEHQTITCKVNALFIAPRLLILNIDDKLIMFKIFAHEILPVDAVWSW